MAKRRTRKEKEKAQHPFLLTWNPGNQKNPNLASVKRHFEPKVGKDNLEAEGPKNAKKLAKDLVPRNLPRDILKSLLIASLILGLELVVYLAWSAG